jgi:pimeloyl-ACP methyl ester carboxylesterase
MTAEKLTIAVAPACCGTSELAASLFLPEALPRALLVCVPGGGVSRGYFNLAGDFSFVRAMTAAGYAVLTFDPPGVGGSPAPDDGFALSVSNVSDALCCGLANFGREHPELAALPCLGVGHSAGAMNVAVMQDRHRPFAAVMLLCFGSGGLPSELTTEELDARADALESDEVVAALARKHFGGQAFPTVPDRAGTSDAALALRAVHDHVIATIALRSMMPGNVREELSRIDVPVLLAAGEKDITGPAHLLAKDYIACRDLCLFIVPQAGHHIFVTPAAQNFFARAARWLGRMTEDWR